MARLVLPTPGGWADEDHIVVIVDKAEIQQIIDLVLADRGLEAVVELLQRLVQRKADPPQVLLDALAVALLECC